MEEQKKTKILKPNKSNNAFVSVSTPSVENKPLGNIVVARRVTSFHRNATLNVKNSDDNKSTQPNNR